MEDHQIKTLSWPAQSPDLNPIENLWNVIKRKMDGHKPSNKAELLEFLCHGYLSYCRLPVSLNQSGHSPLTSLINKVFSPTELPLTGCFLFFCTILCKL
ncbi:hypothetical protein AAFF_G00135980 [Aldrovandia affinis]|uniref:Tc1-like transposase DDE domain-containing protein n=1 Tax=Aldrovandia affinis TaxID=143900 RepID=A0AAD7W8X3_9TELE|nr:hypothetical protein AAFF_G00135980 [Aldrovandia affinis]